MTSLPGNTSRKIPYPLIILLLLSLAARLGVIVENYAVEPSPFLAPDSTSYKMPALAVLQTGHFASSPEASDEPEVMRTPGYPVLLALSYSIFGVQDLPILILQALISTATIYLAWWTGKRLWSPAAGWFAAFLLALDFTVFAYSLVILSETLFTFLLMVSVISLVLLYGEESCRKKYLYAVAIGLSTALSTLVRPITVYLLIPVLAILGITLRPIVSRGQLLKLLLLVLLPWILLVGGWQTRNLVTTGSPKLSHIDSVNLLYYRAAGAVSTKDGIPLAQAQEEITKNLPAGIAEVPTIQRGRIYTRTAVEIITENPTYFIHSQVSGMLKLGLDNGADDLLALFGIKEASGPWTDIKNMPLKEFLDKWRRKPLYSAFFIFGNVYLAAIYLLSLLGILRTVRKERGLTSTHAYILFILIYMLLISTGPEADARFRVPVAPIIALYAGMALSILLPQCKTRNGIINNRKPSTHTPLG